MSPFLRYGLLLALPVLLALVGCSPRSVEVLTVEGPDSLRVNEPGTFQAMTNDDAKPPIQYDWSFGDGSTGVGNPVTHTFDRAGAYSVAVTAANRKGKARDTEARSVIVVSPPMPAEILTILADPTDPDTQTPVRFGANVRGDQPLRYAWSFGDGTTDDGAAPVHTYDRGGTYTVTLDVSNAAGSDVRTLSITVRAFEADYCNEIAAMNATFFDRNASILSAAGENALRENLRILEDCPNLRVRLEGYAGPLERNPQRLSEDRARAVQQFYVRGGIAPSRIAAEGLGRAGRGAKKSGGDQFHRVDSIPMRGDL